MRGLPMNNSGSTEPKVGISNLLRAAVDLTWTVRDFDLYANGMFDLIAEVRGVSRTEVEEDYRETRELVEQDVRQEIKAAETAVKLAEERLQKAELNLKRKS